MFPWWVGPTEAQRAALEAAREEPAAEHQAAVERIREQAHADDEYPDEQPPRRFGERPWDGPTPGGFYR